MKRLLCHIFGHRGLNIVFTDYNGPNRFKVEFGRCERCSQPLRRVYSFKALEIPESMLNKEGDKGV